MCLFRTEYLPDWLKETESSFIEQPRRALGAQRKEVGRRQQGQHQLALPRKVEEVAWVDEYALIQKGEAGAFFGKALADFNDSEPATFAGQ